MKKILVTGGAGFIGSNLCRRLLLDGNEVFCLDNLFSSDKSNIYDLMGNPRFAFILRDVTETFNFQVDEIYHLACPNSPINYTKNPVETIKTITLGTLRMLNLASKIKPKILLASTSKIYGDSIDSPPSEDYGGCVSTVGEVACYTEGKRAAETMFMNYYREYNVNIRIARIFTTYGPNMQDDFKLISTFVNNALRNEDLIIYGDGSIKKGFLYISDLIDGLLKLMNNDIGFIGPVNLGQSKNITIKELATKIIKLIPKCKSKIIYKSEDSEDMKPIDYPKQVLANIELAKNMLNRKPLINFDEGLQRTLDYFKSKMY